MGYDAIIYVENLMGEEEMEIQMTRNNFEIICDSLFKKAKVPVIDALFNADLEASQID